MLNPELIELPEFIFAFEKKYLNDEVTADLLSIIERLKMVKGEHIANAYNRIGVIQAYLNHYEEALDSFSTSLQYTFHDGTYRNYLQTLERVGEYDRLFDEGIEVLCSNPNNRVIFDCLLDVTVKYSMLSHFEILKNYEKYINHNDSFPDFDEKIEGSEEAIINDLNIIKFNNIDINYYRKITNIGFCEFRKLSNEELRFSTKTNDFGEMSIRLQANISKSDLRYLNYMFDKKIAESVAIGYLSFEDYKTHLNKMSFGYEIKNISKSEGAIA